MLYILLFVFSFFWMWPVIIPKQAATIIITEKEICEINAIPGYVIENDLCVLKNGGKIRTDITHDYYDISFPILNGKKEEFTITIKKNIVSYALK